MKNIVLGILIFFCMTYGFTASQKAAKQTRLRREQPTRKSYIIQYDTPVHCCTNEKTCALRDVGFSTDVILV